MWGLVTQGLAVAQGISSPFHGTSRPHTDNIELYAGPYASGGTWASAYDHAVDLVSQMTVEEKVVQSFENRAHVRSTSLRRSLDHVRRIQGEFLDWAFQDCALMMAVSWEALDFRKLTASRWPKVYRLCHSIPLRFHCSCIIRPGLDRRESQGNRKGIQGKGYQRRTWSSDGWSSRKITTCRTELGR
jgi:hypothetical protein